MDAFSSSVIEGINERRRSGLIRFGGHRYTILEKQNDAQEITKSFEPSLRDAVDPDQPSYQYLYYFIPWLKTETVLEVGIPCETLIKLLDKYEVSPRIVEAFHPKQNPDGVNIESRVTGSGQSSTHLWYVLGFSGQNASEFSSFDRLVYHIKHGERLQQNTIFCFDTAANLQRLRENLRIGMEKDTKQILSDDFTSQILFIRDYLDHWSKFSDFMTMAHVINMHSKLRTAAEAVDAACIRDLDVTLNAGTLYIHNLQSVIGIVAQLKTLHARLEDIQYPTTFGVKRKVQFLIIDFEFENLLQQAGGLLHTWNFNMDIFKNVRDSLTITATLNNQGYIRSNSIAMRRMAADSRREATKIQALASAARTETRQMATVAFLTMAYLPGSFVATLFGMDIFGMGDGNHFKAPEKVWIFFTVAVPLTAVTFLIWYLWEKRKSKLEEAIVEEDDPEVTAGDLNNQDGLMLEVAIPKPEATLTELLQEMADKLGRGPAGQNGTNSSSENDGSDNDGLQNLSDEDDDADDGQDGDEDLSEEDDGSVDENDENEGEADDTHEV